MNTYDTMLEKAIVVNTLKSSDIFGVIAELVDAVVEAGVLEESKRDDVKQVVVRREMSASTIMTDEIALPHGRTDLVKELICVIGIHPDGFASDAPDGLLTRVVVMLLIPPSCGCGYIQFLASLSKTLMEPQKREAMLAAVDSAGILAALKL